jgi:hypothetical protein
MAGRHIARRRVLPALTAALAMVGPVASFFVPPQVCTPGCDALGRADLGAGLSYQQFEPLLS